MQAQLNYTLLTTGTSLHNLGSTVVKKYIIKCMIPADICLLDGSFHLSGKPASQKSKSLIDKIVASNLDYSLKTRSTLK